ncbi:MAG: long-chain fatty acid--CoA ligase [Candidatus Bathyarchaeota archaeon]|nr:long-chain fatty acid--CoA ligase [Candidatus Bathyarchaeota archaeon]
MAVTTPENLRELIELHLADRPDQTFIYWRDEEISYRTLNERANRVANGLRALGVGKGDVVSVYLPNCPEFFYTWFGIVKLGAVFGPVNAMFKGEEVRHVLSDSGAVAAVTSQALLDTISAARDECPALREVICLEGQAPGAMAFEELMERPPELEPVALARDDLTAIVYTSGTTGRPKGAMLSHFNYVWDTMAAVDVIPIQPGQDRLGLILPLFHVNAQVTSLSQLYVGGAVAMWERFSPSDFWETVQHYRPTTFSAVPTMLSILLAVPRPEGLDTSSLRYVICGAAPLPLDVFQRFEETFDLRIMEGYGLTEATCVSSLNPYWGIRKVGSIGLPLRGQPMKIVDENMNELPPGEFGEIVVKGPNAMLGYYNNPEATAETIVNGWVRTGDIGYTDEDGYFFIVDRKKEMIIRGGENIYPREVEEVLFTHPKIAEAAVIGRPDPIWGEEVVAVIVPQPGQTLTLEEVQEYCKERLASYKAPRQVEFREDLPKTVTGKVVKKALKEDLLQAPPEG